MLGHEVDVPVILGHDQLADDKSKTDAVSVYLALFVFEWAKQLEKFVLILDFDTFPIVHNWDPDLVIFHFLNDNLDLSISVSKLDGVRKKV